jgi:serine/threonine-protein kinase HipA
MTINGKNENITREDLDDVALQNDIQDYKSLIDMVSNAVNKFKGYSMDLKINQQLIDSIESDFVRI